MNLSINIFKQGVSITLGASSPRSNNSTTCQMCRFNDNIATSCPQIDDLKFKCVKCGGMRHAKDKCMG